MGYTFADRSVPPKKNIGRGAGEGEALPALNLKLDAAQLDGPHTGLVSGHEYTEE